MTEGAYIEAVNRLLERFGLSYHRPTGRNDPLSSNFYTCGQGVVINVLWAEFASPEERAALIARLVQKFGE